MTFELDTLNTRVRELAVENRQLEQLVALFQDNELVTFEGGRYTDDIREVVMELLSLNVSMNKVNDVIKVVLKRWLIWK